MGDQERKGAPDEAADSSFVVREGETAPHSTVFLANLFLSLDLNSKANLSLLRDWQAVMERIDTLKPPTTQVALLNTFDNLLTQSWFKQYGITPNFIALMLRQVDSNFTLPSDAQ